MATRIVLARRFIKSLNRFASSGGPCATDVWARCLQSSAQLNERKSFKKQYSTGLPYPDDVDLKSKLIDMEQKLESAVSKEDLKQLEQNVQKEISSISERYKQLVDDLKNIEGKLDQLNDRKSVASDVAEDQEGQIAEVMKEIRDREYRRRCVIFRNIPDNSEMSAFETRTKLNEALKDLGFDSTATYIARTKQNDLIVKFRTVEERDRVARSPWIISRSEDPLWKNAIIRPFFTQRHWLELKSKVTEKNKEAESEGLGRPWVISIMGTVIKRTRPEDK